MNSLLFIISFTYLVGTIWYYEVDWRNKRRIFVIPSEVLYFVATFLMIMTSYFFYYGSVVVIKFGHRYVYLFAVLLLTTVFLHMLAKYYEDRKRFKGIKKRWWDEVHALHGYISHNLIYFSLLGILTSLALLEIYKGVVVVGGYNVRVILLSSVLFALSLYRTIVHGRLWRTQLILIPLLTLSIVYILLVTKSNVWELPFSLFVVPMLGMSFIMLSCDEVIMRKLKSK